MEVATSISRMQRLAQTWRQQNRRIGFVPTMGFLHEGHLSLIRRARKAVGRDGKVVVSIYVNPTQFGPTEDLKRYPRDLKRDLSLCREQDTDVVFTPTSRQMYPAATDGAFSTWVVEESLSGRMEGVSRPTHFRGVTTVVAKLFNIVLPQVAVFGAKDYQQAAVIQRMVRDLNFPIRIVIAPIVRECDDLAMSSRNKYLKGNLRQQATVLSRAIKEVRFHVRQSDRPSKAADLKKRIETMIKHTPAARLDYAEFFDPETLTPLKKVGRGAHLALAVFIGNTRLIDNGRM